MTEPTFTKEQLAEHARMNGVRLYNGYANPAIESNDLAAFALAEMERAEAAEDKAALYEQAAELPLLKSVLVRVQKAEAERDEARRELAEAEEWVLLSMGVHAAAALALTDEHGDIHRTLIAATAVRRALERAK